MCWVRVDTEALKPPTLNSRCRRGSGPHELLQGPQHLEWEAVIAREPNQAYEAGIDFREVAATLRTLDLGPAALIETLHRPRATTGRHTHGGPRLCLIVSGWYREMLGESEEERGYGSLLFYPPHLCHDDHFASTGARCLNISLPVAAVSETWLRRGEVVRCGVQAVELAYRIYDGLRKGVASSDLTRHIASLLSLLAEDSRVSSQWPDPVLQARRLVTECADSGIALSAVAESVAMDRFALARSFRTRFGCSVGEFRHRVLARRARHALLSTEAPLATIAHRIGFADQSHFTRVFKRYTGLPPGRYRRLGD